MSKKLISKKKLILTSSILLSIGVISSIGLSQISFATNSFDNNIQMLSNQTTNYNLIENNVSSKSSEINDQQIGLKVGGYSPLWVSKSFTKDKYWKTDKNYQYFQAPKTYSPDNYTNPGIAFAWYGNDNSYQTKPHPNNVAAGVGMITYYTRLLEDDFYADNYIRASLLNNQTLIDNYKQTFFEDINNVNNQQFVNFINSITQKDTNYGTNVENKPPFEWSYDSILSNLLFTKKSGLDGHSQGPNINLSNIVFYPTNNDSNLTIKNVSAPNYNKVWLGNESGQEGINNDINSPTVNYNGATNPSLMRALTLNSFTMRTWQDSGNKSYNYQATGNIKFRIFYEYDFIRAKDTADWTYDIRDLKNNEGIDLDDYLDPFYNPDKAKLKRLIQNNYKTMLKNITYTNVYNDAMNSSNQPLNKDEVLFLPQFESLDDNEISIDAEPIVNYYNNNESIISFPVTINIEPALTRQITIKFHTRKNTRVSNNILNVGDSNIITTNVTEADAIKIIQDNLNQIFDNVDFNGTKSKVIKINGFDNTSGAKYGTIYINAITLSPIYDNGQQIDYKKKFRANDYGFSFFEIRGYKPTNELATIVLDKANLVDNEQIKWSTILAQTLAIENPNKNRFIQLLKQTLIDNQIIKNPSWAANKPSIEDFEIAINSFNNLNGSIDASITLNKYYKNAKLIIDKPKTVNIKINGFKTLIQTSVKTNELSFVDELNNFKLASQVSIEEINQFIASLNIDTFLDNPISFANNSLEQTNNSWVNNSQIIVDESKPPIVDDNLGTIKVFALCGWYTLNDGTICSDYNLPLVFNLTGYETDKTKLTTTVNDGYLNNIDNILADSLLTDNNALNQFKQVLIDNQSIQNLNPMNKETLSINDIELTNLKPINKEGTLTCDLTINNSKAWTNGQIDKSKTFTNLTFSGFKIQLPTSFNSSEIKLDLSSLDLNNIQNDFNTTIVPLLKQQINQLVINPYPNCKIDFNYVSSNIDLINGSIDIQITISNGFYDQNGNVDMNTTLTSPNIKLSGFKIQTTNNSTSVNPNLHLDNYVTKVASIEVNNQQLIETIKSLIINPNNLINPNPAHILNTSDVISLDIKQIDNLTGSLLITFQLNKDACLIDGVVASKDLSFEVNVTGFKQLEPTMIGDLNSLDIFNKNQNVVSFVNDSQNIELIKNAILTNPNNVGLNENMFINNLPTKNDINVELVANQPEGSCNVNVTIKGPYVNKDGTINENDYVQSVIINGFITNNKPTTINNNLTIDVNNEFKIREIIPSEINNNQDYLNLIKQAIVNLQTPLFNNLVTNKILSINDLILTYKSFNNLDGSALFDIKLINNSGCNENGIVGDILFKDVTLKGFKQLEITNLTNLNINLDSTFASDFIKNKTAAIETIKQTVYNNLESNMFVNSFPNIDDIKVNITNFDNQKGELFINVEIYNHDYIPLMIENNITNPIGLSNQNQYVKNVNGQIVKWDANNPNPCVMSDVIISGFKKEPNWISKHWLIITLSSISGVALIILIVLLVLKLLGKFQLRRI